MLLFIGWNDSYIPTFTFWTFSWEGLLLTILPSYFVTFYRRSCFFHYYFCICHFCCAYSIAESPKACMFNLRSDPYKGFRKLCFRVGNLLIGFLSESLVICKKMREWTIRSKKTSDSLICSFSVSDLSNFLTSLIKKEGMSESLV